MTTKLCCNDFLIIQNRIVHNNASFQHVLSPLAPFDFRKNSHVCYFFLGEFLDSFRVPCLGHHMATWEPEGRFYARSLEPSKGSQNQHKTRKEGKQCEHTKVSQAGNWKCCALHGIEGRRVAARWRLTNQENESATAAAASPNVQEKTPFDPPLSYEYMLSKLKRQREFSAHCGK